MNVNDIVTTQTLHCLPIKVSLILSIVLERTRRSQELFSLVHAALKPSPYSVHEHNRRAIQSIGFTNLCFLCDKDLDSESVEHLRILCEQEPPNSIVHEFASDPSAFRRDCQLSFAEFSIIHQHLSPLINRTFNGFSSRLGRRVLTSAEAILVWLGISHGCKATWLATFFHNITTDTLYQYLDHVTEAINEAYADQLYWPDEAERASYEGMFACCPTAIGCLDGTRCTVQEPTYGENLFMSGKTNTFNVNYQVICNPFGQFIHVSAYLGYMNDRGCINTLPITQDGPIPDILTEDQMFLSDGAYGGSGHVLTPYNEPELSRIVDVDELMQKQQFNADFALDRALIERRFHALKSFVELLTERYNRTPDKHMDLFTAGAKLLNKLQEIRMNINITCKH